MRIWELTVYVDMGGETWEGICHFLPPRHASDVAAILNLVAHEVRGRLAQGQMFEVPESALYVETEVVDVLGNEERPSGMDRYYGDGRRRSDFTWSRCVEIRMEGNGDGK